MNSQRLPDHFSSYNVLRTRLVTVRIHQWLEMGSTYSVDQLYTHKAIGYWHMLGSHRQFCRTVTAWICDHYGLPKRYEVINSEGWVPFLNCMISAGTNASHMFWPVSDKARDPLARSHFEMRLGTPGQRSRRWTTLPRDLSWMPTDSHSCFSLQAKSGGRNGLGATLLLSL